MKGEEDDPLDELFHKQHLFFDFSPYGRLVMNHSKEQVRKRQNKQQRKSIGATQTKKPNNNFELEI